MFFSFSTIVEFNCRNKKRGGEISTSMDKKNKKKGKKKTRKEKATKKIDTKSSSLLTCARRTLGEAAATAKDDDDDDDDATTRARGGVKKLRGLEEETPARCRREQKNALWSLRVVVVVLFVTVEFCGRVRRHRV